MDFYFDIAATAYQMHGLKLGLSHNNTDKDSDSENGDNIAEQTAR